MPTISVIVCTFNRAQVLGDFLSRLDAHLVQSNLSLEVVLVDNNSTDDTPLVLSRHKADSKLPVTIICEKRQGANFG